MASIERRGTAISLGLMSQLLDARGPEDDWTGLRDRAERRKRQNRLNVRAHRRRRAAGPPMVPEPTAVVVSPARTGQTDVVRRKTGQSPNSASVVITASAFPLPGTCGTDGRIPTGPGFAFPLSRDHLIPLIELNVYRASLTNIYILGAYSLLCNPGCGYVLNDSEPPLFPQTGYHPSGNIPDSLRPTPIQRDTPHEVWIDILPSARMRDNAIVAVAEGRVRNEDLCADILRGICGEGKGRERTVLNGTGPGGGTGADGGDEARLIVWREDDMVRATNRWRDLRGEEPIVWEVE